MKRLSVIFVIAVSAVMAFGGCARFQDSKMASTGTKAETNQSTDEMILTGDKVLAKAKGLAAGYDYDGAIELISDYKGYEKEERMRAAVAEYMEQKDSCAEAVINDIPHIFYHSLIVDTGKAFDGDEKEAGYNQVMTTISEFMNITQQMYDRGYVLVRLRDLVEETVDEDGTVHFKQGKILLPPGKKPYVLSVDDVNYYHYMDGDGFAKRLVINDEGKPQNEYQKEDGTIVIGDYDVVPLLDRFLEEHPDASYRGAKGMIALTGYNGVLGYRTDPAYKTGKDLDKNQEQFLKAAVDFDYDAEVREAKKVAECLRKDGWEFASHTWGHRRVGDITYEELVEDTTKWMKRVKPIVGSTDTIIFAFGQDIGNWKGYSPDNQKYEYLKSQGFHYYCNVDSSQHWVQIQDEYVRQGRRNLDGYRIYYDVTGEFNKLSDLFDAASVFDKTRPTPVPPMGS